MVTIGDWTFLIVTGLNQCCFGIDVVMFAVWKAGAGGPTVAVETGGGTVASGQTANFYVPVYGIGAGTYTVLVFGVTANNYPVTSELQVQMTLALSNGRITPLVQARRA